jgi:hypothetical protein
MQRFQLIRNFLVVAALAIAATASVFVGASASAVTQSMAGTWGIVNPSVPFPYHEEVEQRIKFGSVNGTLTNDPAVVGQAIVLPANFFSAIGQVQNRVFIPFPSVAQLTFTYTSNHIGAVFAAGGGAAGTGAISFCPPIGNIPPAPTGGDTLCSVFTAVGGGTRPVRLGVTPGVRAFGGALRMVRDNVGQVWFNALGANPKSIFRQTNNFTQRAWAPGLTNFEFTSDMNPPNTIFNGSLSVEGRVTNIISTVGTAPAGTEENWGFKFTTGTVRGSDAIPAVATCGGAPPTTPGAGCFFFTSMGNDTPSGSAGARNIVMVSGAVNFSPGGQGNNFNRLSRLTMVIPEPSAALGAATGLAALAGLIWMRRNGKA